MTRKQLATRTTVFDGKLASWRPEESPEVIADKAAGGREISLNDIEHRILRPIWKDPRIHYAVNCASLGCPNLSGTPFTAANKEELLDQAAADYVNHPRGVAFVKGRLRLSSIYDWYGVDFGSDETERLAHLQQYATRDLAEALMNYSGRIKYDYEWDLNGQ